VRTRLTVLYGGLFFAAGTALLGVTYTLAVRSFGKGVAVSVSQAMDLPGKPDPPGAAPPGTPIPAGLPAVPRPSATLYQLPKTSATGIPSALTPSQLRHLSANLRSTTLHQLLASSVIALVLTVVIAVLLGWWIAGRTLRPLHRITSTARRLSWENLHERIALDGPADELKDLADTFDSMLTRLDHAFESQRRFIANASHELRTPLAIQRAMIQIRLPRARADQMGQIQEDLLAANRRSEQIIDGLLLLARSDRGLATKEPVDLDAVVADVAARHRQAAAAAGLRVDLDLHPVTAAGDTVLLTQLVTNLVLNAIRYNVPGGTVRVCTSAAAGLVVCNTGPAVAAESIPALFEPFCRPSGRRTGSGEGTGLGLSVVRSIAAAHNGALTASPNENGGLTVQVAFPPVSKNPPSA